jgi:hypothetical protein
MIEDLARSKACLCKNAEMPGVFSVKVMHKVEFSLLANSTWMHIGKVSRILRHLFSTRAIWSERSNFAPGKFDMDASMHPKKKART